MQSVCFRSPTWFPLLQKRSPYRQQNNLCPQEVCFQSWTNPGPRRLFPAAASRTQTPLREPRDLHKESKGRVCKWGLFQEGETNIRFEHFKNSAAGRLSFRKKDLRKGGRWGAVGIERRVHCEAPQRSCFCTFLSVLKGCSHSQVFFWGGGVEVGALASERSITALPGLPATLSIIKQASNQASKVPLGRTEPVALKRASHLFQTLGAGRRHRMLSCEAHPCSPFARSPPRATERGL